MSSPVAPSRRPRVAVAPRLAGERDVFLLESYSGAVDPARLFAPKFPAAYEFDLADAGAGGDFDALLVPHAFGAERPMPAAYAASVLELGARLGLKPLLLVSGDLSHGFVAPGFTLLRATQYRDARAAGEIIVPPFCEDFGAVANLSPRPFPGGRPVVGFCGWAAFAKRRTAIKARLQSLWYALAERLTGRSWGARVKGVLLRRAAMDALRRDPGVECRFVVRRTFSGAASTISVDPETARREYVENALGSDFALAPKGDANYSVRFFEALSLGRVPVLVDTETCLPCDDVDYDRFVVRVPYRDVARIGAYVREWLAAAGPAGFAEAQRLARQTFVERLRYDAFFSGLFRDLAAARTSRSV